MTTNETDTGLCNDCDAEYEFVVGEDTGYCPKHEKRRAWRRSFQSRKRKDERSQRVADEAKKKEDQMKQARETINERAARRSRMRTATKHRHVTL